MLKRFLCYGLVFLAMGFFLASCQKDESVQDLKATAANGADTAQKIAEQSPANNFLVSKGTLVIKLPDTSYTFDAAPLPHFQKGPMGAVFVFQTAIHASRVVG